MSWFSILPAHLTIVETWIIRFFVGPPQIYCALSDFSLQLLLATITIGPWVLALVYDMILYLFRAVAYEIPYYGGRAQGKRRPQAPTLTERPNGRRRTFSITGSSPNGNASDENGERRRRSFDSVERDEIDNITEEGEKNLKNRLPRRATD